MHLPKQLLTPPQLNNNKVTKGLPWLQTGFTLIEMLVVIAIISILIGIGVNTFTIAQKKARDVRRKADLRNIQTALELYKQDNGTYPLTSTLGTWVNVNTLTGLTNYINSIPKDPSDKTTGCFDYGTRLGYLTCFEYDYWVNNTCAVTAKRYVLGAHLENDGDPDSGNSVGDGGLCNASAPKWYFVTGT